MLLHVHQWKNETLELYGETPVRQFTVQHECWGNKRDWDQCQGWWHRRIALHCLSITSESEKGKMIFDSWESIEGYYNASFEGESQCFSRVLGQSDKCKKDFIFWRWTFPALCTISPYNHTSMRGAVLFFHDFGEVQQKYSPNAPADTMRDEEPQETVQSDALYRNI